MDTPMRRRVSIRLTSDLEATLLDMYEAADYADEQSDADRALILLGQLARRFLRECIVVEAR